MSDMIDVVQKSAPASNTTQIGVQYIGLTPEQAAKQMVELFMDNFPKLQQIAKEIAEKRATELCDEIFKKMEKNEIRDFTAFTDPDVQFVLYEAQKNYARFGESNNLDMLTELIVNRIQNNTEGHFKRVVDNAIIIACQLSDKQLDCLSALFVLTKVKFSNIKTIDDLRNFFIYISQVFNLESIDFDKEISYLNCMRCLQIELPNICQIQAAQYELSLNEVEGISFESINQFSGDYGISEIGILLAIVNAEKKSKYRFNPHIWINR